MYLFLHSRSLHFLEVSEVFSLLSRLHYHFSGKVQSNKKLQLLQNRTENGLILVHPYIDGLGFVHFSFSEHVSLLQRKSAFLVLLNICCCCFCCPMNPQVLFNSLIKFQEQTTAPQHHRIITCFPCSQIFLDLFCFGSSIWFIFKPAVVLLGGSSLLLRS